MKRVAHVSDLCVHVVVVVVVVVVLKCNVVVVVDDVTELGIVWRASLPNTHYE
jgi:hypothetical protein